MARALPTARVMRWVPPAPGMTPRLISGWPNWAVSLATIMSQAMASSQPPPRAKPETAAITGLLIAAQPVPVVDKGIVQHVDHRRLGHLLDVRAGGKGALVAGDDDGADGRRRASKASRASISLAHQRRVEGVERLEGG